jgi:hypothetical protein
LPDLGRVNGGSAHAFEIPFCRDFTRHGCAKA